ncbi:MAG: acetyl-CoA hydrolase/transferase family protein, partial [Chitinophagaceae bacterium]
MPVQPIYCSAEEALSVVRSGDRVFVHGSAQTPHFLLQELARQKDRLTDVELVFITVKGEIFLDKPGLERHFQINSLFVSDAVRQAVQDGRADYIPVFLSDIPDLFQNRLPIDVALVQVSPPDQHGFCTLGASVDIARSAVNTAKRVIGLVNPQVPRTHGDGLVSLHQFTHLVYHDAPLPEENYSLKVGPAEQKIGELIAGIIEDGSTLQMGIGTIPDAVLKALTYHKNLGVHTEMCSDGVIPLLEAGVINNSLKKIHPNKTVTSFAVGTRKLYQYIHDNPSFAFLDIDYVNDPHVISRNANVVAINSAIEVDLTGQVCA